PPRIYTLSLHDALPILGRKTHPALLTAGRQPPAFQHEIRPVTEHSAARSTAAWLSRRHVHCSRLQSAVSSGRSSLTSLTRQCRRDRKSTRLNSSHVKIS